MLRCMYIACMVIFISYQEATLYVSIHSFDKPVNKYAYSSRDYLSPHGITCVFIMLSDLRFLQRYY